MKTGTHENKKTAQTKKSERTQIRKKVPGGRLKQRDDSYVYRGKAYKKSRSNEIPAGTFGLLLRKAIRVVFGERN